MSLETRLKAAFERVAATIKLRGVPAGGTAGQVLTKASGSDYDAGWVTPAAGGEGGGGTAGRGIATITVSGGHLTGTYSDGTAWDAGALPAGSGGGLDAEAVQDIVGQMLGETQGHYDDAAGTYTINLPAGSSMTDEQVQDIVGALIRAGSNVTVAYDDAAGTLTVSASGSGGKPRLSANVGSLPPLVALSMGGASGAAGLYWDMTPTSDVPLYGLRIPDDPYSRRNAVSEVWRVSDGTLMAISAPAGRINGAWDTTFDAPTTLSADQIYRVGMRQLNYASDIHPLNGGLGPSAYRGIRVATRPYQGGGAYPSSRLDIDMKCPFTLKTGPAVSKGIIGPLDPADFPLSTIAAAPPSSGFMVVDAEAKKASLYWKFSDDSTKKIDLA